MEVRVDTEARTVTLEDPEDCQRFQVAVAGPGDAAVVDDVLRTEAVGSLVADDPTHAWVGVSAVRRLAAGRVRETWERDFEAMLAYAGQKGWLDEDGAHIKAHLEPQP